MRKRAGKECRRDAGRGSVRGEGTGQVNREVKEQGAGGDEEGAEDGRKRD